jgi:hypothetical protein
MMTRKIIPAREKTVQHLAQAIAEHAILDYYRYKGRRDDQEAIRDRIEER